MQRQWRKGICCSSLGAADESDTHTGARFKLRKEDEPLSGAMVLGQQGPGQIIERGEDVMADHSYTTIYIGSI